MRKSCDNCEYLGYYETSYEETGDSGFFCEGRDYFKRGDSTKNENDHLEKLQNDKYRHAPKKCFQPKDQKDE